jgi:hypothetical protein
MPPTTDAPRSSLLSQHMRLLGFEPGALDAAGAAEARRVASIELPPLVLDEGAASDGARASFIPLARPRRSARISIAAGLLLAAGLAALVLTRPLGLERGGELGLRVKGEGKVWLYWERAGVATAWQPGTALVNGDRVRAEVLAGGAPTTALAVVESGDGRLLSDPAQAWSERLELAAGERKSFTGSVKLVGADDDEHLVVLLCPSATGAAAAALQAVFPAASQPARHDLVPKECALESFQLR